MIGGRAGPVCAPTLDTANNVVGVPIGKLYRFGSIGYPVRPDRTYRVTVEYNNTTGAPVEAGGMGVIGGLFVPAIYGLDGNAAFMLHDEKAGRDEIRAYLQKYGLYSEKEADQTINFISNPLYRSYIFTFHVGYDLLKELFSKKDRHTYFTRLLEEPVTPSQIRQRIGNQSDLN